VALYDLVEQFVKMRKSRKINNFSRPFQICDSPSTKKLSINISAGKFEFCNNFIKKLQTTTGPTSEQRALLRLLKPKKMNCCKNCHLVGHGWRKRSIVKKKWWSNDWGTMWYWRIRCKNCNAVHCLYFTFNLPSLYYPFEIVADVIITYLKGNSIANKDPCRQTCCRWITRFINSWKLLKKQKIISTSLTNWITDITIIKFKEVIQRCWNKTFLMISKNTLQQRNTTPTN